MFILIKGRSLNGFFFAHSAQRLYKTSLLINLALAENQFSKLDILSMPIRKLRRLLPKVIIPILWSYQRGMLSSIPTIITVLIGVLNLSCIKGQSNSNENELIKSFDISSNDLFAIKQTEEHHFIIDLGKRLPIYDSDNERYPEPGQGKTIAFSPGKNFIIYPQKNGKQLFDCRLGKNVTNKGYFINTDKGFVAHWVKTKPTTNADDEYQQFYFFTDTVLQRLEELQISAPEIISLKGNDLVILHNDTVRAFTLRPFQEKIRHKLGSCKVLGPAFGNMNGQRQLIELNGYVVKIDSVVKRLNSHLKVWEELPGLTLKKYNRHGQLESKYFIKEPLPSGIFGVVSDFDTIFYDLNKNSLCEEQNFSKLIKSNSDPSFRSGNVKFREYSPDGKWVVFKYSKGDTLYLGTTENGKASRLLRIPDKSTKYYSQAFSFDQSSSYFLECNTMSDSLSVWNLNAINKVTKIPIKSYKLFLFNSGISKPYLINDQQNKQFILSIGNYLLAFDQNWNLTKNKETFNTISESRHIQMRWTLGSPIFFIAHLYDIQVRDRNTLKLLFSLSDPRGKVSGDELNSHKKNPGLSDSYVKSLTINELSKTLVYVYELVPDNAKKPSDINRKQIVGWLNLSTGEYKILHTETTISNNLIDVFNFKENILVQTTKGFLVYRGDNGTLFKDLRSKRYEGSGTTNYHFEIASGNMFQDSIDLNTKRILKSSILNSDFSIAKSFDVKAIPVQNSEYVLRAFEDDAIVRVTKDSLFIYNLSSGQAVYQEPLSKHHLIERNPDNYRKRIIHYPGCIMLNAEHLKEFGNFYPVYFSLITHTIMTAVEVSKYQPLEKIYSPDKRLVYLQSRGGQSVHEAQTGRFLYNVSNIYEIPHCSSNEISLSNQGHLSFDDTYYNDEIKIIYFDSTRKLTHLIDFPTSAYFSNSRQASMDLITGNVFQILDGKLSMLSLDKKLSLRKKLDIIPIGETELIIKLPDGVYLSSKEAWDQLYSDFAIDPLQFRNDDLKKNAPAEVLKEFGHASERTISFLREMSVKRQEYENAEQKPMPIWQLKTGEVTILDRPALVAKDSKSRLQASFSILTSLAFDDIKVLINNYEVPKPQNLHSRNYEEPIQFRFPYSSGMNLVQIIINQGSKVYYDWWYVYSPEDETIHQTTFIGFGSDYKSSYEYEDLEFTTRDIVEADSLFRTRGSIFNSYILTNSDCTKENLLELRKTLSTQKPDDSVILYLSGHGDLIDSSMKFVFICDNTTSSNADSTGISIEDILEILRASPSRNKLVCIDACYSGMIDVAEYMGESGSNNNSFNFESEELWSAALNYFNNIGNAHDIEILASSGGLELSLENPNYQSGELINLLKSGSILGDVDGDGFISNTELRSYIYHHQNNSEDNQDKNQTAQFRQTNPYQIWNICKSKKKL